MKLIDAELLIKEGDVKFENKKDALILFRILQEFISNSVKHAQAMTLKIVLTYTADHLILEATDDGKGFDLEVLSPSSGLINMRRRAHLVEDKYDLVSQPKKGTQLPMYYPLIRRG